MFDLSFNNQSIWKVSKKWPLEKKQNVGVQTPMVTIFEEAMEADK